MIDSRVASVQCIAIASLAIMFSATLRSQTAPPPVLGQSPSTTNLSVTPSPLVLPGGLQLTSIVNQTPTGGAAPTGSVSFYSDTTTLLGAAPLKVIPSSETWTEFPFPGAPITQPVGLASVQLLAGFPPVVVSAQSPVAGSVVPNVALYESSPGGTSLKQFTYTNPNQTTTDAIVSGYFLLPKSSGIQSFLVHEFFSYQVFDGSTPTPTATTLNPPVVTSFSGCDCASDPEKLSVADFDNDGYSDVGVLIPAYSVQTVVTSPSVGIALNAGVSRPGSFNSPMIAPPPVTITPPNLFCPIAIATGNFTAAAGAQLAVLASQSTTSCQGFIGPHAIYLYALNATKTALIQVGTPLVLPDTYATTLASADLNHDGISDLLVGEFVPGPVEAFIGGIRTVLGNGDGTFKAPSAIVNESGQPLLFTVNDFNGDGFVDVAYTMIGGWGVLFGDGAGNLAAPKEYPYLPPITYAPGGLTSADFNLDGLADVVSVPGAINSSSDIIDVEFSTASSQAVLTIASKPLPAGTHTLTATFPGDINFAASTSAGVTEVVTKTLPVVTWTGSGTTLEYGTLLSSAQLNATATVAGLFSYSPGVGALLPPGKNTVTATFTPTDAFDYAGAVSTFSITVGSPALSSISPTSVNAGSANTTITATGVGFVSGAVVSYNGTALATTYVDQHHVTAIIPSTLLLKPGTNTVTVADPGGLAASGSQSFSVVAPAPVATVLVAEATVTAGKQSTVTLTVNPYPLAITATATLTFTPLAPITVQDPAVLFANNTTTDSVTIAPATAPTATLFQFQAGSTAGTITITIHLTLAGGQDITPANLAPVTIIVPPGPPVIVTPTLTRSGKTFQIAVIALSSTREMTEARFHFTPATGKSLKTTDVTVQLSPVFQTWYGSTASNAFGTNFMYTQPFTLDGDATDVGTVSIILVNSNGPSAASTVQ